MSKNLHLMEDKPMGPPVEPVGPGISRPTWSVMIPTYNCARLLAVTLGHVLSQDPGPGCMQIEVIDDCSTRDDPEEVVRALGRGRIGFYRQPRNVGATRNFNTCVERSIGYLVHILHGDDWVLPGFYDRIELSVRRHPQVAFFGTRSFWVDGAGDLDSLSPRIPHLERPGNDIKPILYTNPFCTPAVVVRRRFYEGAGGFLADLIHTADWEMWVRAISSGGGCMINQALACYRRSSGNETSRLAHTGENLRDYIRLSEIFRSSYDGFDHKAFIHMVADSASFQGRRFRQLNDLEAAIANEDLCRELTCGL